MTEFDAEELAAAEERRREADRTVCDLALLRAQSYQQTLGIELNGPSVTRSLDELRTTPLGRKLDYVCAVARGDLQDPPDRVADVVNSVLQALFWTPGMRKPRIPFDFWRRSFLGREIARAKILTYAPDHLVELRDAAKELEMSSEQVKGLLEGLQLDYFFDPDSAISWVIPPESMGAIRRWKRDIEGEEEEIPDYVYEFFAKQDEEDRRNPAAKVVRERAREERSLRNDDGRYEPETGAWVTWDPVPGPRMTSGGGNRAAVRRRYREIRERYYALHYGTSGVNGNQGKEGAMQAAS
ncbi:MAG: hypothetical protein M3Q03_06850 [Chloroflexota bacterium]|nr:hypothetical protein [Chloroflexota bacterium]